jgi:hypothetical protein
MYDNNCNAMFVVPPSTLVNGSTNATATGTAPAATVTKSEGGREYVGLGLLVLFGAFTIAL